MTERPNWLTGVQLSELTLKYIKNEPDMEQWIASKLGKDYVKAVYCHPAYLIYMPITSCEMSGWMNLKLESRLPGEMLTTTDMQILPP